MKKRKKTKKLNKPFGHRKAMLRDLACEVIQRERITTTVPKAKAVKPVIARAISVAKRAVKDGDEVKIETARKRVYDQLRRELAALKVFEVLVERYKEREGGYTRIIRLGPRAGDGAELAYIELVEDESGEKGGEKRKIKKDSGRKKDSDEKASKKKKNKK